MKKIFISFICSLFLVSVAQAGRVNVFFASLSGTSPPTLSSATIGTAGATIDLLFNENVTAGAGGNAGWSMTCSTSGAVSMTYDSGSGTGTLSYTLGSTVQSGETCTCDYTQPGDGIESSSTGEDLASISDQAVTNNSTQSPTYLFAESYEGTGYENTWAESVGSGCTIDEDSAGPGSLPDGGGSQCIQFIKSTNSVVNRSYHDYGSTIATCYVRFYLYVATTNFGTDQGIDHILALDNSSIDSASIGVKLLNIGTTLSLQPNYYTGFWNNMTAAEVNTGQWYCVEILLDTAGGVAAWRLDGSLIQSVSGQSFSRGPARYINTGTLYSGIANSATFYIDRLAVDDGGWIGQ